MEVLIDMYYIFILNFLTVFSRQKLKRILEPVSVTTESQAVLEYDNVLNSPLILIYALNMKYLSRILKEKVNLKYLDLACGPSVFGLLCSESFHFSHYDGVDLSMPMLEKSEKRFKQSEFLGTYDFHNLSIMDLRDLKDQSYDLITIMDCAHHLDKIEDVTTVINEAEKKIKEKGVIFISDVIRPHNFLIFKIYYRWISKKNIKLQMFAHNLDFNNSIQAAFTIEELASAIPSSSNRDWYQISTRGFKYTQMLIGVPKNTCLDFSFQGHAELKFIPRHLKKLWTLTYYTFQFFGKMKKINKQLS
jgi:ubiquinone/menaquinone biosynthesis C-methylase UbiE